MGQDYVAAAALHYLEGYHIQNLDLGTLIGDSTRVGCFSFHLIPWLSLSFFRPQKLLLFRFSWRLKDINHPLSTFRLSPHGVRQ